MYFGRQTALSEAKMLLVDKHLGFLEDKNEKWSKILLRPKFGRVQINGNKNKYSVCLFRINKDRLDVSLVLDSS